jgi:hypothetical protein
MKKIYVLLTLSMILWNFNLYAQLNTSTGITWGELSPSEPLVLNENFQGFEFFHTDPNTDAGNSDNKFAEDGITIIYGYKNDTVEVPIIGSASGKINYYFNQCAFAPAWKTAYAFQQEAENTANVTNGFVEISRDYASNPPTVRGWFIVDLRALDFVEVIQWTHSSTGGNKRGVMCEFSVDNGTTWDTLRYQPGSNFGLSFTKDVTTRVKTSNGYRCDPSAFGMTWEDGIWSDQPIMLRFAEAGGQTPRIHDLKVYGNYTATAVNEIADNGLKIYSFNKKIRISEVADVVIYRIDGAIIKSAKNTNLVSLDEMPDGIYLVKAKAGNKYKTTKVLIK